MDLPQTQEVKYWQGHEATARALNESTFFLFFLLYLHLLADHNFTPSRLLSLAVTMVTIEKIAYRRMNEREPVVTSLPVNQCFWNIFYDMLASTFLWSAILTCLPVFFRNSVSSHSACLFLSFVFSHSGCIFLDLCFWSFCLSFFGLLFLVILLVFFRTFVSDHSACLFWVLCCGHSIRLFYDLCFLSFCLAFFDICFYSSRSSCRFFGIFVSCHSGRLVWDLRSRSFYVVITTLT
jgi:hypothetical protein